MDFEKKKLIVLGDLHIGHPLWDKVKNVFEEELMKIWDSGADIFLMGDLLECQTRNSVGKGQIMDINEQVELVIDYFKDFAEAGRLIGMISGNHEDRINKDTGNYDLYKDMCSRLGTKPLGRWTIFEYYGLTVYATHPRGAATTDGGRDLWFRKILNRRECDLYLVGHFHTLYNKLHAGRFYHLEEIPRQKKMFMTGSILHYELDYVEERAYEPQLNGYIELDFENNHFKATPHYLLYDCSLHTDIGLNNKKWNEWEYQQTPKRKEWEKKYRDTHIFDVYPIEYECYHCHTKHSYKPQKKTTANPSTKCKNCKKRVSLDTYFQRRERTPEEMR